MARLSLGLHNSVSRNVGFVSAPAPCCLCWKEQEVSEYMGERWGAEPAHSTALAGRKETRGGMPGKQRKEEAGATSYFYEECIYAKWLYLGIYSV